MARIRTIKPDFPHSESMGRVSRDARLLFVLLWTLADDAGRLRGNSRMLASLLFPYDDDAPTLIGGWLDELESENCILRYSSGDERQQSQFVEICNWGLHQKIDKPSASKLPPPANPREDSPKARERSSLEGKGREGKGGGEEATRSPPAPTKAPSVGCPIQRVVDQLAPFIESVAVDGLQGAVWAWCEYRLRADSRPPDAISLKFQLESLYRERRGTMVAAIRECIEHEKSRLFADAARPPRSGRTATADTKSPAPRKVFE